MSLQQSKAEKNESQPRKLGRSSGAGHQQQTLKSAEVGGPGPHSSSNRGGKRANGPVGQSRGNSTAGHPQPNANPKIQNGGHTQRQTGGNATAGPSQPNTNLKIQNGGNTQKQQTGGNPTVSPVQPNANQKIQNGGHPPVGSSQPNANQKIQNGGHSQRQEPGLDLSDAFGGLPSTLTKKPNSLPPKVNGLQKPPISLASNVNSSKEASSVTTVAVHGESSSAMVQQPFQFQFGSFSPVSVSDLQVPARTCSAPPNFNEQKHDEACFSAVNDASVAKVPSTLFGSQQQLEVVSKQGVRTLEQPVEGKKNWQEIKAEIPVVSTKQWPGAGVSSSLPVQPIHTLSSQVQSQCLNPGPVPPAPLQLQLQMGSAIQPQVQPQIFGSQNMMSNALQSQQGMMHQVHSLSFPQTIGPPLPHIIPQQVNSMTSHMPSQQFPSLNPQIPYQLNPQLGGSVGTRLSTYMSSPPTNPYMSQRTNMAVKITHPETHEELSFGPKGIKSGSQTDNSVVTSTKDSLPPAAGLPTYRPLPSASVALNGSRPMNLYPAVPAGSYGNMPSTFHPIPKTKSGISNDSHPLTGQGTLTIIHTGEMLDILKPIPQAVKTTLAPVQVLEGKTNSLPESLGKDSSSLAVAVVSREDNCSVQLSISPVSEVLDIDKSDGIKLSPVNMTAVTASNLSDVMVSNCSVVSATESGLNHHASEKQKSISAKQVGLSTSECSNKMTKSEHKPKKQQMQQQASLLGSSSNMQRELKGGVVAEASELSGSCRQPEELLPSQTSLSTSTAPLAAAPQKTVKAVHGGATSKLAIETVLHSSLPEPDSAARSCGSFSNSTKCAKIPSPKKPSENMVNVMDTPSLGISGVSASADEITERDTSRENLEPLHDSKSVNELVIADVSSYLGTSGQGSEGKTEATGLVKEFFTKDAGVVKKAVEDVKLDNSTVLVGPLKSSTSSLDAIKTDSKFGDVKNKQSKSTSSNANQSCSNIIVKPVIGENQDLGNVIHLEPGVVMVSDTPSVLVSSTVVEIEKEVPYFANSIIGKEKASLHARESKINEMHDNELAFQQVKSDNGTMVNDKILFKEKKVEVLAASLQSTADSGKVAEQELQLEAPAVLPKGDMAILEEKSVFLSGNKSVDLKQSFGYRNKSRASHESAKVLGEGSAANVKAIDTEDKGHLSNASDIGEMAAQPQVSSLPVESEGKQDLVGRVTEKENKSSSNVFAKNNVTNVGDAAKTVINKKKKKKELLSKANAAAPTGDLYNAYKVQEEKQEDFNPPETSKEVVTDVVKNKISAKEPEKQVLKEVDDWEDAAELSTTVDQVALSVTKCSGDRKYSRDFLLTIKDQCKDIQIHFDCPEIIDFRGNFQALASHIGEGDALTSTAKGLDRQPSGSYRLERRGSNMASLDDDRWAKPGDASVAGRDIRMDVGPSGSSSGFRTGQGYNTSFGRVSRGAPMNSTGILHGGPYVQTPFQQAGLVRNNSDADRWQRASGLQKGLIPPPQPSLPTIHKSENRYEVGKVSDEDQLKQRQIKSILNRLTPQNFDKLFEQVKEVNIDSAPCLHGVISQIFDKALMEPTFCEMYAKFCVQLAAGLPEFYEDNEKVVFKRVLLNKCQEEFERDEREQAEAEQAEEHGEGKLSAEERREKKAAARRRMLGNIRFIGELYKESMLTERIMHECIKKLIGEFQHPEEENVEALCKLMSTIGHMIDHSKAKEHIDAYFFRMTKMSNNQGLPSRLRFMLRDLIDLRKNGWQQRRKVEGPKKIEEVHRDAVQELHGQGGRSRGTNMGHSGRRPLTPHDHGVRGPAVSPYSAGTQMGSLPHMGGSRAPQPHMGPRDRGFTSQDARIVDRAHFDNRSMPSPLTHRASDDGHITLGPQGGLGKGIAGRGQPLPYGRSALADVPPLSAVTSRRTSAGLISGCNSDRMPPGMRDDLLTKTYGAEKPLFAKSGVQERNVFDNDRREFKSSYSSGDKSGKTANDEFQLQEHSSQGMPSSQLSEVQLKKKAEMAIKEFYSVRDKKEAAFCVDDLKTPLFHPTMVSLWITDSFDRKDVEVDLLGNLLTYLCMTEPFLLNKGQLLKGLESVLSLLEDNSVDAPKAPEFLGRILAKLVVEGVILIQDIARAIKDGGIEPGSLLETGHGVEVLGAVLEDVKRLKGEPVLSDLYSKSEVHLESFMPKKPGDFEGFLKKKNIQCLYPVGISRHL